MILDDNGDEEQTTANIPQTINNIEVDVDPTNALKSLSNLKKIQG